jgi:TolB-like protein/DNA-binding winged helix-turn-helix (wHTH) protein
MQTAGEKPYGFAGYTLDLRQRCLRSGDREIELRPKSLALLCHLVENAGRLVPKDELVKELWPNVIVTDESLARCVSDVRLALDDGERRIIKTVPGQGYLLAAPVSKLEPRAVAPSPDQEPDAAKPPLAERRPLTSRTVFSVVALLSIMIVAGGLWRLQQQPPPADALVAAVPPSAALARLATQTAPRMSIVVLPFANLSSDPALDYFADGFTENLTTDLSRISGSFVIARATAYTYKSKALSVKEIASQLGVRYVLEGGVQKQGDHVRVNAQLIDGETGAHLWAERYERDGSNLLQVQDEITHQIANALNLNLIQSESDRSWRDHPTNADSIDLTLRADALYFAPLAAKSNADARLLYERAVELDPKNVNALLGLGWTYLDDIIEGRATGAAPSDALKRADDAATRALSVHPRSAGAYHLKSEVLGYTTSDDYRGEIVQAIAAAEVALEIDPNRPQTLNWLGRLYAKAGHPERTPALAERSIRLSPHSPFMSSFLYTLGMAQLQMGLNDEAIDTFQRSVLLAPRQIISWGGLTGAFIAAGRDVEAQRALIKWREVAASEGGYKMDYSPDRDVLYARMELALLRLGRWPYSISLWIAQTDPGSNLSRALLKFQVDEKLPRTGQPDEATLARIGISSQQSASLSK